MRLPLHLWVGRARWVLIPTPLKLNPEHGSNAVPSGDTNKWRSLSLLALTQDKVSSEFVRSTAALVVSDSSQTSPHEKVPP